MMKNPERRKDEGVINCARACPDVAQAERSDDAGILRQMRFIVPDKPGSANAHVGQEDQEQEQDRANQTHPPLDNTRFTEGHRVIDRVAVALLSTRCSLVNGRRKSSSQCRPKSLILAIALLGGVGLSLLRVSWQIIGQTNPRQPIFNPSVIGWRHCRRLVEAANGDIYLASVRSCEEG